MSIFFRNFYTTAFGFLSYPFITHVLMYLLTTEIRSFDESIKIMCVLR